MLKNCKIEDISENAVKLFKKDWGLLAAGSESYNAMTISWGTLGELWGKDVCTVFVRPQRYTFEFTEKNDFFTVSFFPEEYKKALAFCGSKSGRDYDKAKETGLTAFDTGYGTAFEEAKIVICCKKLYADDFNPEKFSDKSIIDDVYPTKDYHRVYIGEIVKVLASDI